MLFTKLFHNVSTICIYIYICLNKVRECVLPKDGSAPQCDGESEVTETCNDQSCPGIVENSKTM